VLDGERKKMQTHELTTPKPTTFLLQIAGHQVVPAPEVEGQKAKTFYVYLNDGAVEEITPMTGILFTKDELLVLLGERPVVHFAKRDVYFAGYCKVCPGVLF
jgi:hypothetical protein